MPYSVLQTMRASSSLTRVQPRPFVAVVLALLLAGCNPGGGTRPVSLAIWQSQVQEYVSNHGNGDLNALHDVEVSPGQPGFRAYSNDRPEDSKDLAGVLVGAHPQGERLWYVYLVGELDKEQVTTLRLAAISQGSGTFDWRLGGDEGGGAASYLGARQKAWSDQHGTAAVAPRSALGFPSDADTFTMNAAGDVITVRETVSGAQWTLNLTDQQPSAGKPSDEPPASPENRVSTLLISLHQMYALRWYTHHSNISTARHTPMAHGHNGVYALPTVSRLSMRS